MRQLINDVASGKTIKPASTQLLPATVAEQFTKDGWHDEALEPVVRQATDRWGLRGTFGGTQSVDTRSVCERVDV